jgi:putative ABC transport system permease protein
LRLLKDVLIGDIGKTLWTLMATVGIVLLMACASVANLFLVRAMDAGRSWPFAPRSAPGGDAS